MTEICLDPWNHPEIAERYELLMLRGLHRWGDEHPALGWYTDAAAWVRMLAKNHKFDPTAVAQAVAVLSPQVSWESQRTYVPIFLMDVATGGDGSGRTHPGFLRNRMKAAEILRERDPMTRARMVSGPKVRAFAQALQGVYKGITVIDTHMIDAGLGIPTPEDREIYGSLTAKRYAMLNTALLTARARVCPEVDPHAVQALVWEEQRRKRGLA